ncbi:MAG: hypothetical protein H8E21_07535 [Gammaproteobacteria bacterium]|nr:hypothetical protein [Gammaproteobacteria bacterium]
MHIFISNLPRDASLLELQHFLGNHEMSIDYSTHRRNDHSEHHFLLIKTNSHESAGALIKELNGKLFHGIAVEARRFIERKNQQAWDGKERRNQQLNLALIFPEGGS